MRWLIPVIVLGCSSKSSDSGSSGETVDPLQWSLDEPGPYSTGFQSWDVTYSPGDSFPERTIRLNLWYPTEDEEGPPAEYTIGVDELSFANANPAPPAHEAGYPVHAYSHGFRGYGEASAFMSRHMASHGWVTVAPNHTQNTFIDHSDPLPSAHYFQRPLDIRAVLDALEGLSDDHSLAGQFDTERVMISGHSFGAYTTWSVIGAAYDSENVAAMCSTGEGIHDEGCTAEEESMFGTDLSDSRVVSSLPMAGTLRRTWFGESGEGAVNGPVLFMGGTEDDVGQDDQFDEMGAIDFTWMELEGGCHQTFALGSCTTLEREEGFHIVQTIALAWARHTVLNDDHVSTVDVLTGASPVSSVVSTRIK